MNIIALTKREKDYIQSIMNDSISTDPESKIDSKLRANKYDLNYRLKKKFLKLHEDYWTLVSFFKTYDQNFQIKTTEQTSDSLLKAKSQIPSSETLVSSKCFFCKGTGKKMIEINICTECQKGFGF